MSKDQEALEEILKAFGIESFDLLLIGDGSGSRWGLPCGWGCISIRPELQERRLWYGAMNSGTVNVGEAMAYVAPLCWYVQQVVEDPKQQARIRDVHIITDSSYVERNGESGQLRQRTNSSSHTILWDAFKNLKSHGLDLHWHWCERDVIALNSVADRLSKFVRSLIQCHIEEAVSAASGETSPQTDWLQRING